MLFFCWFDAGSVLLWCCFLVESLLFSCWQNVVLLLVLPSKWHFHEMARYAFVVQSHLVRERPKTLEERQHAFRISMVRTHAPLAKLSRITYSDPNTKGQALRLPLIFSTISQCFALRPSRIASILCTFYCYFCQYLSMVGLLIPNSRAQSIFFLSGFFNRHSSTAACLLGLPSGFITDSSLRICFVVLASFKCSACFLPFRLLRSIRISVNFSMASIEKT